jgi:hypothetical protein
MFEFEFINSELKSKFNNLNDHYPIEVSQELPQFIEALKEEGLVRGTDYFRGHINRISAKSFDLTYISDFDNKIVKVLDLKVKSKDLLRERFDLQDSWDDKDVIDVIPQCDSPAKLIKALKLIFSGVVDSYELGYELGHRGKKKRYISRHGQYTRQALEALHLIESRNEGKRLVPELTERGKLIATTSDVQLQNKLLTVAMLNYYPVWKVIGAITEGNDEFSDETIQKLVFPEELRDADTCSRRTSTLRTWIKWISTTSGIPIRLPGGYKQLTLPMIFSENQD